MAKKSSKLNINGKQVTVETELENGAYTVKDSKGRTIGSGDAASGGNLKVSNGNLQAQQDLLGIKNTPGVTDLKTRIDTLTKLTTLIKGPAENENKAIINNNADSTQKLNLRDMGYGNALDIPGVTVPVAPNNTNGGDSDTGGNSGKDKGKSVSGDKDEDGENKTNDENPEISTRNSTKGDYEYPLNFTIDLQDHVLFQRIEYVNSGVNLGSGAIKRPSERLVNVKPLGTTTLPMPKNLQDASTVGWGEDKLNPLQAMGAGAISGLISGVDEFNKSLNDSIDAFGSNKDQLKNLLKTSVAGNIVGSNIFTRTTGAIMNNNLELLFSGTNLRTFNFNYKLTPREAKEALECKSIIRSFKQSMMPILSDQTLFLNTPNVYKIKFIQVTGNEMKEHKFLNRIKPCALVAVNVVYTPDNAYMTYGDGSMVGYDLSLSFKELEPIYSNDYDVKPGDGGMGF